MCVGDKMESRGQEPISAPRCEHVLSFTCYDTFRYSSVIFWNFLSLRNPSMDIRLGPSEMTFSISTFLFSGVSLQNLTSQHSGTRR